MRVGTIARRCLWDLPRNTLRFWQMHGPIHFLNRLIRRPKPLDAQLPQPLSRIRACAWQRQFPHRPLISLIVPLPHNPPQHFEACLESIASQFYENWELLLIGEPSQHAKLPEYILKETRVDTVAVKNGKDWAHAANAGVNRARGTWLGFLHPSDQLTPDAITWMVAAHNRQPQAVWLYSDEATITHQGGRAEPFFKPAYSPAYLLSSFYTGQLSLYSAERIKQLGGIRFQLDGTEHYDLALRFSEHVRPDQVVHIPRILCHQRESKTTSPTNDSTQAIVREALARRGLLGEVRPHPIWPSASQICLKPNRFPSVRIVIPTHNGFSDLQTCLDSIHRHTRYPNYRITVIDNRSTDEALLDFLNRAESEGTLQVVRDPRPFNHSQMHNEVIADSEEDFVVLMNNDVELLTPGWLGQLVATAETDSSIAGVGALLLYPDRTVQHGGMVLGRFGIAGHLHCELPEENPGYFGQAHLLREVSGTTAALLLMRRSTFVEVGGFDQERYPTSFNDVDLWVRLGQRGYRCLYNPAVKAIHYESKTRKTNWSVEVTYRKRFRRQWGKVVRFDPFSNPNLSLENEAHPHRQRYRIRSWKTELFRCLKPREKIETSIKGHRAA